MPVAWLNLVACQPDPPALWLGGDVFLGEAAGGWLDPGLRLHLPPAGLVNLEGAVGDAALVARVGDDVTLRHGPEVGSALAGAGVVAATLANNHATDGPSGRSAAVLAAAGVTPVAGPARYVPALEAWVAALDLSTGPDGAWLQSFPPEDARLIVGLHVTGASAPLPTRPTREAVDVVVAAGADVVVVHGTHTVGPVERRGDTIVAWGLGNLAFRCACGPSSPGLVLVVDGDDAWVLPVQVGREGATRLHPDPDEVLGLVSGLGPIPLIRGPVGWRVPPATDPRTR